jgi:hypothetical protein
VDGAGEHLLAGAAFPQDQDGHVSPRRPAGASHGDPDATAIPGNVLEPFDVLGALAGEELELDIGVAQDLGDIVHDQVEGDLGDPGPPLVGLEICAFADGLRPLPISARSRLDDALRLTRNVNFGGTDCSLPMLYALQRRLPVDAFVVLTDSETWAGSIHPVQALRQYRERMSIPARLIVVGMVSNGFTIADPNDGGMMGVVGFDAAAPQLMGDFMRG